MSKKISKIWLILLILFILFILFAIVFSQWQTSMPKFNLSSFSSNELFKAGQQKVKEGDFKEARVFIEAALEKDGQNITYLGELAVVKYKLGDLRGAIEEYQKIYDSGDYPGFALNGIANIYRDISEKTEDRSQKTEYQKKARATYEQGIKEDKKYIALYSNYAILLSSLGDKIKAKKVLEEGIVATDSQTLKDLSKNF